MKHFLLHKVEGIRNIFSTNSEGLTWLDRQFLSPSRTLASLLVVITIALGGIATYSNWSLLNNQLTDLAHHRSRMTKVKQTATPTPTPVASTNMLNLLGYDFSYTPGVTQAAQKLTITGINRQIIDLNGTTYHPNPPVTLYGPYVKTSGAWQLQLALDQPAAQADVLIYSTPPVIYDEFIYDGPSAKLHLANGQATLSTWQGSDYTVAQQSSFTLPSTYSALQLVFNGNVFTLQADGQVVGSITHANIGSISSGTAWLGFDAPVGQSYGITQLQVAGVNNSNVEVADAQAIMSGVALNPQGWQQLANHSYPGKIIGAAIALGPLASDAAYRNLVLGGWYGGITTENALKPQFVHPQPSVYSFSEGDALVAIAQQYGLKIHGHTLVFGEANPQWMNQAPAGQLQQIMTDHITTVVSHYAGKISSWDVVNEPLGADYFDGPLQLRDHIWEKAMGANYIALAFATAHAADPNAQLFMNEYGLEADGDRWTGFLSLVEDLLKKNVPINGVGFQSHVYEKGDEIDATTLAGHFNQLAALGQKYNHPLVARISEMDVYGENTKNQTTQFSSVLKACMQSPVCQNFTMWGVTEKYSSTSWIDDNGLLQIGDGLPFDATEQPLSAVAAMQQVLQ